MERAGEPFRRRIEHDVERLLLSARRDEKSPGEDFRMIEALRLTFGVFQIALTQLEARMAISDGDLVRRAKPVGSWVVARKGRYHEDGAVFHEDGVDA